MLIKNFIDKYLTYLVVERKYLQNIEVTGKYYIQPQARNEASIRVLAENSSIPLYSPPHLNDKPASFKYPKSITAMMQVCFI